MALGDRQAEDEVKGINKELGYILDAVSSIGDQLVKSFEDAVDGASDLNGAVDVVGKTMQRGLVADLKKAVQNTNSLIDLQTKVTLGTATQKDIAKEAEKIALNEARLAAKRQVLGDALTDTQKELLAQEQEQLEFQKQALKAIQDENTELQKQKSFFQVLKENSGAIADKIDKTGTLSKILSGNLKDVVTPMRLAELAIVGIFNAAVDVDEQTGKLAKNLNISADDALQLQNELKSAANSSLELSVTTKGLGQALMAINGELGIFNTTIDKNLVSFEQLHKTAGLTYEELSGVSKITNATGGDLEANTKEVMAQARLTGQRYKVALNEKDILKDISKVSAATTLSLSKNPGSIANAVATAKALGMELGKVDDIAGSLLDFESSIENELSAELLLNKDLNLEKARQAALNNDLATVASEIAKQAGSAAEFAEMNRIQQDALAKAVGMNREELAKTLFTQEQIGNLSGEEYALREKQINDLEAKGLSQAQIKAELGKQSIDDLKNQNSVQEKLTQSVDKMKEVFVSLAVPIMQIVTPIVDILTPAVVALSYAFSGIGSTLSYIVDSTKGFYDMLTGANTELGLMQSIIGAIVIAYGAIAAYNATITGFKALQQAMDTKAEGSLIKQGLLMIKNLGIAIAEAVAKITGASAATLGIAAGIALAAGATAYAFLSTKKGDDVVSAGGGSSTHGNRTLMGPEGAIALNNKDTVIAGTNLFPKNGSSSGGNTVVKQDNSETNSLLKQLISTNQEGNQLQRKKPELSPVGLYEVQ
jgi:hypothetical protein